MNRIKLRYPLLVEGSYDKNRVSAVADGNIITCEGFSIFNSEAKQRLLRRITEKSKLLILTDSDGAGMLIRNKLKGILQAENIINIYAPAVKGKEKRKKKPSKAGLLGVEGMSDEVLYNLLSPYAENLSSDGCAEENIRRPNPEPVTAAILYEMKLTGVEDSSARRKALCRKADLPENLSPKAFREALNMLGGLEYLKSLAEDTL